MNREERKIKNWIENNLNYNNNSFETIQDLFLDYCEMYKIEYKEEYIRSFSIYFSKVIKEKDWKIEKGKLNNKRGYYGLELFNSGTSIGTSTNTYNEDFLYKTVQDKLENMSLILTCLVQDSKDLNIKLDNLDNIYNSLKLLEDTNKIQDAIQFNIKMDKMYNKMDSLTKSLESILNTYTVQEKNLNSINMENMYLSNKTSITPISTNQTPTNNLLNTKTVKASNKKNKLVKTTHATNTTNNTPSNINISSYISTYKPGNNKYETKDLYEDYKSFYKDQPNFLAYIPTVNQFKRKFEENWYKVYPNNKINTKARIGKNGKGISGLDKTN